MYSVDSLIELMIVFVKLYFVYAFHLYMYAGSSPINYDLSK